MTTRLTTLGASARALARRQRLLPWFFGTRLLMLLFTLNVIRYINPGAIWGDVALYDKWVNLDFRHGVFPTDLKWQYPPGAATPLLAPKLLSNALVQGSYFVAFYAMCFIADALIFRMLLKSARAAAPQSEAPSLAGPWAWTLGLAAIGPMVYGRYDLVVTAFAVGALTVALKSKTATSATRGVLIGIGTAVKLWPAAILFGVPRGRQGRITVTTAVLAAAVPSAIAVLAFPDALTFFSHEGNRGIQIESVFATPFLVGRWFGWSGHIENSRYGAYEFLGPGVTTLANAALAATVLGFAVLLLWRWKARHRVGLANGFDVTMLADVSFAATMVAIVTSRVLSPQYLIWILGLGAVCLTRRDSIQRVPSLITMGAIGVTQVIFPLFYRSLRGGQVFSGVVLVGRNVALVTATVLALLALFRWIRHSPDAEAGAEAEADNTEDRPMPKQVSLSPSAARTAATSR
jgi:hypothetical protein